MADRDYKSELLKLVEDVNEWASKHLEKKKHSKIANRVYMHSTNLRFVAECRSQKEARAALHGADMILHMLLVDAQIGQSLRRINQEFKSSSLKADAETINKALDQACKDYPGKNPTYLRKKVGEKLGMGRSTLLGKTTYDPTKK